MMYDDLQWLMSMVEILLSFTDLPKFRGSGKHMVPIKLAE